MTNATNYNYFEEMFTDIKDVLNDDYYIKKILEFVDGQEIDFDGITEMLNDDLWVDDTVTGNASGSYTCNTFLAREYVTANTELLQEALKEFCVEAETIAEKFLNDEWEYFDVTIRCYILGQIVCDIVENYLPDYIAKLVVNN